MIRVIRSDIYNYGLARAALYIAMHVVLFLLLTQLTFSIPRAKLEHPDISLGIHYELLLIGYIGASVLLSILYVMLGSWKFVPLLCVLLFYIWYSMVPFDRYPYRSIAVASIGTGIFLSVFYLDKMIQRKVCSR
jgi:hypothetical protein